MVVSNRVLPRETCLKLVISTPRGSIRLNIVITKIGKGLITIKLKIIINKVIPNNHIMAHSVTHCPLQATKLSLKSTLLKFTLQLSIQSLLIKIYNSMRLKSKQVKKKMTKFLLQVLIGQWEQASNQLQFSAIDNIECLLWADSNQRPTSQMYISKMWTQRAVTMWRIRLMLCLVFLTLRGLKVVRAEYLIKNLFNSVKMSQSKVIILTQKNLNEEH